jgi:tetratricopeptide (TPR) repeat protein
LECLPVSDLHKESETPVPGRPEPSAGESARQFLSAAQPISGYVNREGETLFGRDDTIAKIADYLKSRPGAVAEVHGLAGAGKSCVCANVLKSVGGITVDARAYPTTAGVQLDILRQLGISGKDVTPQECEERLLTEAKRRRCYLNIDHAETPLLRDGQAFRKWLPSFARKSGWGILCSTQKPTGVPDVRSFRLNPLEDGAALALFLHHWRGGEKLTERDRETARYIAGKQLSRLPLAILIAASPAHRDRYGSLPELRRAIETHMPLEFPGDPDNPHRSISAALGLALSEIADFPDALLLWALIARYRHELSDELLKLALEEDLRACQDAGALLQRYALLTGYWMAESVKEIVGGAEEVFCKELRKAALHRLCRALRKMFEQAGDDPSGDRRHWHETALEHLPSVLSLIEEAAKQTGDIPIVAPLLNSARNYYQFYASESVRVLRRILPCYEETGGNPLWAADILQLLGDLEQQLGEMSAALERYAQAEALYRAQKQDLQLANVLRSLGNLERRRGALSAAIGHYHGAYELYGSEQEPAGRAYVCAELCKAYVLAGERRAAMEWIERAAGMLETIPERIRSSVANSVQEALGALRTGIDQELQGELQKARNLDGSKDL